MDLETDRLLLHRPRLSHGPDLLGFLGDVKAVHYTFRLADLAASDRGPCSAKAMTASSALAACQRDHELLLHQQDRGAAVRDFVEHLADLFDELGRKPFGYLGLS
jgi:hypothetical protein